jgi:hypothetical protein
VQPIALGAGFAVVFAVCSSAAEMRAEFSSVRRAQLAMLVVVGAFGVTLVATHSIVVSVWVLSTQHALALTVLWRGLRGRFVVGAELAVAGPLFAIAILTCVAGFAAFGAGQLVDGVLDGPRTLWTDLSCVATGALVYVAALLLLAMHPAAKGLLRSPAFSFVHRLPIAAKLLRISA